MAQFIAWGQQFSHSLERPQPPGNTLPIVDFAYEHGFDGVEIDVQVSKDGVKVLMHDFTLDANTGHKGTVASFTFDQLQDVTINGSWEGAPLFVPSFESALRLNGDRGKMMCDLRQVTDKSVTALRNAIVNSAFDLSKLMIIAYNRNDGSRLKAEFPEAIILLKSPVNPPELNASFASEAVGLDAVLVNAARDPDLIRDLKLAGQKDNIAVCAYLHHRGLSVQSLRHLCDAGADYVTTQNHHFFDQVR